MEITLNLLEKNFNVLNLEDLSQDELTQIEGGLVPIAMAAIWAGVKIGIEVGGILYGAYYLSRQ